MSEILEYQSSLISITGGQALHMQFSHYDEAPARARQVVAEAQKERAAHA
jgi:translation elongation factor EF-G